VGCESKSFIGIIAPSTDTAVPDATSCFSLVLITFGVSLVLPQEARNRRVIAAAMRAVILVNRGSIVKGYLMGLLATTLARYEMDFFLFPNIA